MRPDEYTAVGDLAGRGYGSLVSQVRGTHAAIAARVFGSLGSEARTVELAHDAIAGLAYASAGAFGRTVLRAAGHGVGLAQPGDAESIDGSLAGRVVKGALNGVYGDLLSAERNPLAVEMTVRAAGREIALAPADVAAAFAGASGRLAVFVHGLCETDDAWRLSARGARAAGAPRPLTYGERLHVELGYTPVYVRYNSGLHVSENGRQLSALLDELVRAWPVEVVRIALVGHSLGGLVARSACHYGGGSGWCANVADVFTLGAPHDGAPLERGAHALACALARVPETRPVATAINARSAGIKDCGKGYLTDECWAGQDPEAFVRSAAREIPFLPHANHYFVSATLSRDPDHPIGRHIGDLLVLHASAWGGRRRGERLRFPIDNYRHYGGATHFDLLGHPAIGEQLVKWLAPRELEAWRSL